MKKAMAFALALALVACFPMTAFAAETVQDTQTDEVEVAATENGSPAGPQASPEAKDAPSAGASPATKASTPATGDDTSFIVPAGLALGASALVAAGVATKRFGSAVED